MTIDELRGELDARGVPLAEVARRVGVSRALVSYQFHGHRPLSAEVRAAALAILRERREGERLRVAREAVAGGDLDLADRLLSGL